MKKNFFFNKAPFIFVFLILSALLLPVCIQNNSTVLFIFSLYIFFLVVCEGSCKPGAATRTFLS